MVGFSICDLGGGHSPRTIMVRLDILNDIAENVTNSGAKQRENNNNYNCD